MKPRLSVIVPCYNEQLRFGEGFNHYYSYLKKQSYNWELIFVDDGSQDGTYLKMESLAKMKRNVKIISYSKNKGKGYAIITAVKKTKGKYVLFGDLDHSVDIATIERFLRIFVKGVDVVIGSRRVLGARIAVHQQPWREFLGRGFTFLVRILIDPKIVDATCGFKAFEEKVAKKIFNKLTVYDWSFDAEILFLCKKYNFKLIQAPVVWRDVHGTKVSLKKDVIRSLIGLIKIRVNDFFGRY